MSSTENTSNDARLITALKDFIPHMMRQNNTPGLNLALARRGKVIWEEGFGYANLEKKTPMTKDTVFRSGSMCKTYTAIAVMQLVEKGVIGLDDPINKYLKEFQVTNPLGDKEITFRHLLTHTAGFSSNTAGSEFVPPLPLGEHLKTEYQKKMFEPYGESVIPRWSLKVGERFMYSNFGIATLGYMVEVTNPEKLSFSDYVQKHIIDPMGMTSTQYPPIQDAAHIKPDIFKRISTGYGKFGPVHIPTPMIYFADYPAGNVVSIPREHIRLLLAFLNNGAYEGYQLLKPETVKLMLTPQVPLVKNPPGVEPPVSAAIGLVWALGEIGKEDYSFGHGGAHMYGWNNQYSAYPNLDFALVVATNHWDIANPTERGAKREYQLIAKFISTWIKNERRGFRRLQPDVSWAWKTSYVIGLLMADALQGILGIESPVTPEMIEKMAHGARMVAESKGGISLWDAGGFRAGLADMLSVKPHPEAMGEFLKSEKLKVAPEELEMLYREIGGGGTLGTLLAMELPSVTSSRK